MSEECRPPGVTALSLLFAFGAVVCGVLALLLFFPGSVGTPPPNGASPVMITISLLLMLAAGAACIAASVGLWRCTRWGMWTALAIISANVLSDLIGLISTRRSGALVGLPLFAVLGWYVWKKTALFRPGQETLTQGENQAARTPV